MMLIVVVVVVVVCEYACTFHCAYCQRTMREALYVGTVQMV